MRQKLTKLLQEIEAASRASIIKKPAAAEKAVKTAASLSADLVRAYEDLESRLTALEIQVTEGVNGA